MWFAACTTKTVLFMFQKSWRHRLLGETIWGCWSLNSARAQSRNQRKRNAQTSLIRYSSEVSNQTKKLQRICYSHLIWRKFIVWRMFSKISQCTFLLRNMLPSFYYQSKLRSKGVRYDFPCNCTVRYVFLVETYQYITYLDLVAKCEVFSRELFYVTNFWKIKISLGDFQILDDSLWAGRYGSLVGTY